MEDFILKGKATLAGKPLAHRHLILLCPVDNDLLHPRTITVKTSQTGNYRANLGPASMINQFAARVFSQNENERDSAPPPRLGEPVILDPGEEGQSSGLPGDPMDRKVVLYRSDHDVDPSIAPFPADPEQIKRCWELPIHPGDNVLDLDFVYDLNVTHRRKSEPVPHQVVIKWTPAPDTDLYKIQIEWILHSFLEEEEPVAKLYTATRPGFIVETPPELYARALVDAEADEGVGEQFDMIDDILEKASGEEASSLQVPEEGGTPDEITMDQLFKKELRYVITVQGIEVKDDGTRRQRTSIGVDAWPPMKIPGKE